MAIRTGLLLLLVAVLLYRTVRSLRAQRLKEKYVLLFLATGVPFVALAAWPEAIVKASEWLQIEKATLLIFGATCYFILTTFSLLSIVSVQDRKIASLSQIVAILQAERQGQQVSSEQAADEPDDAGNS